jgi:hypothetical protein
MNNKSREETTATVGRKRLILGFGLVATVLALSGWLLLLRYANLTTGENSFDCYYHVRMADLGPSMWTTREFSATMMSVWTDSFYDKELGFHALLYVFRRVEGCLPLSPGPPFHFPSFCLCLVLLSAFVVTARGLRVPWIPLHALMLLCISPVFTERVLMLRPHNLSVSLILLCCLSLNYVQRKTHLWVPVLFGFVLAWSYSAAHFVLVPAMAFCVAGWKTNRRLHFAIPVAALLGLLLGFTLHPQFPNTFVVWKVQCVDVALGALLGTEEVGLGVELSAPGSGRLARNCMVLGLTVLNAVFMRILWVGRKTTPLDRATAAVFLLNVGSCVLLFFGQRAIEYACPFAVLTTGLLVRDLRGSGALRPAAYRKMGIVMAILLLVVAGFTTARFCRPRDEEVRPVDSFAQWADTNLTPGTVVANVIWSDFPMLFYSAPEYRYLMGLDPMFGYCRYPERVVKLEQFRQRRRHMSPEELSQLVDARYAFVSVFGKHLAADMESRGFETVYEGSDGWLFDLGEHGRNNTPHD